MFRWFISKSFKESEAWQIWKWIEIERIIGALKVKCEIERPVESRNTFDRKKGISWQVADIS